MQAALPWAHPCCVGLGLGWVVAPLTLLCSLEEWAGVPKDVVESFKPNYSENICYVTELPPKDSHEPLWDSSNHAPPPMPGPPAAPNEHSPYQNSYGRV